MGVTAQEAKMSDFEATFDRAKRLLTLAAIGITGGLAIAGSVERTAGGVILLAGWAIGIIALHRLGRAGSVRPKANDRRESTPR